MKTFARGLWGWALAVSLVGSGARAVEGDVMKLLENRQCASCRLQDADLVWADLRDANLTGAQLQRANLSQARLDGANLRGADLRFTSLQGASLRGADLRGAQLLGTDLRQSDLSGAQLDPGALERSHWEGAQGLDQGVLSYAALHNAGVAAALGGRQPEAERLFGEALRQSPDAAITWLARGLTRADQGKPDEARQDLDYAAELYARQGDQEEARRIQAAAVQVGAAPARKAGGNGMGSALLNGAVGLAKVLAPLAIKALAQVPMGL
ncbi:MAG: pentapeptide repeat-containing protein [Cyanobacteriota bacterium]|nr:pentapeptide repeat-containing protein [Cyanobacteriota bacterium]